MMAGTQLMRGIVVAGLLVAVHGAHFHRHQSRDLVQKGGWSLSVPMGSSCPITTSSCFTNQTGNNFTQARGNNCCPSQSLVYNNEYGQQVQTPLYCGTYVNTGQPYACCPLGNADCRGDVGKDDSSQKCANSGWAQWRIPDGGFNHFCCLPGQYGYWLPALGQDAVGQCSTSRILPAGSRPAEQLDNGDGSVAADGTQLTVLPNQDPLPAPVCDIIATYGWSLQVSDASQCTNGSSYCGYGVACCPNTLSCGTVIGDSEVPVCCPANNPDCRGDVEGLAVQPCADSSWSLWHVNTNGNHFCCKPGQIGYNKPNDNTATGFCGSAVPPGNMRSILDFPGDGSTAGSYASFPCDSDPAPLQNLPSIISAVLNPVATGSGGNGNNNNPPYPTTLPIQYGTFTNGSVVTSVYTTTITTCPADSSITLTYLIAGVSISGTAVPTASQIIFANPTAQAVLVSDVMASAYAYTVPVSSLLVSASASASLSASGSAADPSTAGNPVGPYVPATAVPSASAGRLQTSAARRLDSGVVELCTVLAVILLGLMAA